MIRFPFGKYRGREITDVPLSYLEYLLKWDELREELRTEIENVISQYRAIECIIIPDLFIEDTGCTLRDMFTIQRANRRRIPQSPITVHEDKEVYVA